MIFIVLHYLRESFLWELLESVSIKQWAWWLTNCIPILLGRRLVPIWLVRGRRYLIWPLWTVNLFRRLWGYNRIKTWELAWLVWWTVVIVLRVEFYIRCLYRLNAEKAQLFDVADFCTCSLTFSGTFNGFKDCIGVINLIVWMLLVWVCFFWTMMTLSFSSPTVIDFVFIDT